LIGAQDKIIKF